MLKQLKIVNFQRHKKRVIDLDPHVTTIIGKNGAGKSSVIGALQWLAFNDPLGTKFIRHGSEECEVILTLDKCTVTRTRGKKINEYSVNDHEPFKAFNDKVPDEIQTLLNLAPINFQNQFDGLYWLSNTAGEVSRQLNEIVNLSVIDDSLASMASSKRQAAATLKVTKDRLSEAEDRTQSLTWVPAFVAGVEELEQWSEQYWQWKLDQDSIHVVLNGIREASKMERMALPVLELANKSILLVEQLVRLDEELFELKDILSSIDEEVQCQKTEKANMQVAETELREKFKQCPLCGNSMKRNP